MLDMGLFLATMGIIAYAVGWVCGINAGYFIWKWRK